MKAIAIGLVIVALIAGCASPRAPAPVDERRAVPVAPPKPIAAQPVPVAPTAAAPQLYTVKRGDTLYSIALEQGVDYRDLVQWNRIDDPTKLRIGQQLRIGAPEDKSALATTRVEVGAARGAGAVESRPLDRAMEPPATVDPSMKSSPKALRLPYSESNLALLSKGETTSTPAPAAKPIPVPVPVPVAIAPKPEPQKAEERDPEAIEFVWPARGRLLAGFAEPNSKGVDIGGKIGDAVVAAAAGRVIYTGTGIRGLGKLIVIRHDNNFQSVYAHNREILVKEGQTVTRGQRIAELGDSDSDTPKLHFEIRRSGKPVDPLRYLPPS